MDPGSHEASLEELKALLKRIAEALERISPPPGGDPRNRKPFWKA
jgi:hypothetical protein